MRQTAFEITHPDYPGERLVCCRNPALAEQRTRKRNDLLAATEKELEKIAAATRHQLRGRDKIALRVGKMINHYNMAKHFDHQISDSPCQGELRTSRANRHSESPAHHHPKSLTNRKL